MFDRAHGVMSRNDFPSTEWKVVLNARDDDSDGRAALGVLCQQYWYPIYAFVRSRVRDVHKAQDLTQGFFTHLLTHGVVASADQSRGRFRDFLLACCRNYLWGRWRWSRAKKNGGGVNPLPLDFAAAEVRFLADRTDPTDPERRYTRTWALAVLERTTAQLRATYVEAGDADLFDRPGRSLTGAPGAEKYPELGTALGLTLDQVKKAAARLRAGSRPASPAGRPDGRGPGRRGRRDPGAFPGGRPEIVNRIENRNRNPDNPHSDCFGFRLIFSLFQNSRHHRSQCVLHGDHSSQQGGFPLAAVVICALLAAIPAGAPSGSARDASSGSAWVGAETRRTEWAGGTVAAPSPPHGGSAGRGSSRRLRPPTAPGESPSPGAGSRLPVTTCSKRSAGAGTGSSSGPGTGPWTGTSPSNSSSRAWGPPSNDTGSGPRPRPSPG